MINHHIQFEVFLAKLAWYIEQTLLYMEQVNLRVGKVGLGNWVGHHMGNQIGKLLSISLSKVYIQKYIT